MIEIAAQSCHHETRGEKTCPCRMKHFTPDRTNVYVGALSSHTRFAVFRIFAALTVEK